MLLFLPQYPAANWLIGICHNGPDRAKGTVTLQAWLAAIDELLDASVYFLHAANEQLDEVTRDALFDASAKTAELHRQLDFATWRYVQIHRLATEIPDPSVN